MSLTFVTSYVIYIWHKSLNYKLIISSLFSSYSSPTSVSVCCLQSSGGMGVAAAVTTAAHPGGGVSVVEVAVALVGLAFHASLAPSLFLTRLLESEEEEEEKKCFSPPQFCGLEKHNSLHTHTNIAEREGVKLWSRKQVHRRERQQIYICGSWKKISNNNWLLCVCSLSLTE